MNLQMIWAKDVFIIGVRPSEYRPYCLHYGKVNKVKWSLPSHKKEHHRAEGEATDLHSA
jgi:hypothetical protein